MPQLPYTQPQSAHSQGEAHLHASGALAQPHDLGAEQAPPSQQDAQPDEKNAIPAETMPAANRFSAEFFMSLLYHNPAALWISFNVTA